jgi:hypothetical protein
LQNINFSIKKLWFPLVSGGILASLSMVAIFKNIGNPWLNFFLLLGGLFFFYYGNQGTSIMTILSGNDTTHLYIGKLSPNLKAFTTFVLNYISKDPVRRHIFLVLDKDRHKYYEKGQTIYPEMISGEKKIRCLTIQQYQNLKLNDNEIIVEIDPLKVNAEIRYEWDDLSHDLYPCVHGNIPGEAVI